IIFFKTRMLSQLVEFYINTLEMTIWLEQPECTILKHGNMLIGFCQREHEEIEGMITYVYDTREEVDRMYERIKDITIDAPHENSKYRIYQFFARDLEGRALEFQVFLHTTSPI
ncbi:MAG: VOC family protein, partial [Candidatus Thorarchaeota archaeon]